MRGVNSTLQLAAALDRHGVTANIHWKWVNVWLRDQERMVIKPSVRGPMYEIGRMWAWEHNGKCWSHPRGDWEGVAEVVAAYIAKEPMFANTRARLRVDRMSGRVSWDDQPRRSGHP